MPQMLPVDKLPLELPEVDKFLPTETGEPPLGHAVKWAWDTVKQEVTEVSKIDNKTIFPLELCTMPGFAGSSAYYLRYICLLYTSKVILGQEPIPITYE